MPDEISSKQKDVLTRKSMGQSESFFKYVIAYFYSKNGILLTMSSEMGLIQIIGRR